LIKNNTDEAIVHIGKKSGEVYGETPAKRAHVRKPHVFVLMYCNEIARRNISIPPALTKIVLMIDENNKVKLNRVILKELSVFLRISMGRLRNHITEFVENDLLLRLSPAEYFVNPLFFTKSNNKNISELRSQYEKEKLAQIEIIKEKLKNKCRKLRNELSIEKAGNLLIDKANHLINNG